MFCCQKQCFSRDQCIKAVCEELQRLLKARNNIASMLILSIFQCETPVLIERVWRW